MTAPIFLTDEEVALLRDSPVLRGESRQRSVELFYQKLFERRPDLKTLFSEDISEQSRKFAATLAVSIFSISDWAYLRPVIEALARRHLRYGVAAADYDDVGEALGRMLVETGCTDKEIAGWTQLYGAISGHMVKTAYPKDSG